MISDARRASWNTPLFCLSFPIITLPKRSAFGKVTWMGEHLLLPQMTASLYLGHTGGMAAYEVRPTRRVNAARVAAFA
jgi:hypothetical protein